MAFLDVSIWVIIVIIYIIFKYKMMFDISVPVRGKLIL